MTRRARLCLLSPLILWLPAALVLDGFLQLLLTRPMAFVLVAGSVGLAGYAVVHWKQVKTPYWFLE